ncbi:hypothetical protein [Mammaliicoccus sciuri]|uniref:hypothetical protein n=1 Tax=Mammaliicoccus sciuri TaxID=1296 RepID=UPI002DB8FD86|nr:hypothetical protein [Mammaliicoccus sciuri]MEB7784191.1 hypothetical protein [Mammaliicoccus sciuri]
MKKQSLLNTNETTQSKFDNTLITQQEKEMTLPQTTLRVKGATHSKILALKKIQLEDSYDNILEEALNLYINQIGKSEQEKLKLIIEQENDYKLKKALKKNK